MAQVAGTDTRQIEDVVRVSVNATLDGDNTVVAAPGANRRIKVIAAVLTTSAAANPLILKSGANELARFALPASGQLRLDPVVGGQIPWFECNANEAFIVTNPAAVDTLGLLAHIIEPT